MIVIKNKQALSKMEDAGYKLATLFEELSHVIKPGVSTGEIDAWIESSLKSTGFVSKTKGFRTYKHASCISVNDEVVHGVPNNSRILVDGDLVKVDVCASYDGYCADMARPFFVGTGASKEAQDLVSVAQAALDAGIAKAVPGNRLSDISHAIQTVVEKHGYGVVRDFAGHGIGKHMHEDPEVLNYGAPGKGPLLQAGMTFAIEPMITQGKYAVYVCKDGWTVKTADRSLAAHVEDTVAITESGPRILTRKNKEQIA